MKRDACPPRFTFYALLSTFNFLPMLSFTPQALGPRDAYRLLISLVVPRPIGWASTIGADGTLNIAPFSFFNGVGDNPPTVMISVGQRRTETGRAPKDTLRNAQETGEYVINIVDETLSQQMNITSGEWGYEVNEFEKAGLHLTASTNVRPPRVAEASAALECQVTQIVPVQDTHYVMILGQVLRFHVRENLMRPNGTADPALLRPVGRLGGDEYAPLGPVFTMTRPPA
jgi:flavin reductase (DIM6/NTAB) family NADH-FMN oxidoreductase RutF